MKRYLKNKILILVTLQILAFASVASAQDRDPFSPTGGGMINAVKDFVRTETAPEQNFDSATPLTSTQLNGYKVIGAIISENTKVASVKAINGVSYVVKVGDSLGSEGGKISEITTEGITIQTEGQAVKLPVNNKLEVPVNAAQTKND